MTWDPGERRGERLNDDGEQEQDSWTRGGNNVHVRETGDFYLMKTGVGGFTSTRISSGDGGGWSGVRTSETLSFRPTPETLRTDSPLPHSNSRHEEEGRVDPESED